MKRKILATAILVLALLLGSIGHSNAISDVSVRVTLGQPEIVMDYSKDSCRRSQGLDLPDVQAHAVRSPLDQSIILISGNAPVNYTMVGTDFNSLKRNCTPALISGDSPHAYTFDNQEWLLSVYREGDKTEDFQTCATD